MASKIVKEEWAIGVISGVKESVNYFSIEKCFS